MQRSSKDSEITEKGSIMSFEETAPTLASVGITEIQVYNFFDNQIQPTEPQPLPPITKPKIVVVAKAYYEIGIEESGGIIAVARDARLTPGQVKTIASELKALEAIWSALPDE